MLHFNKRKTQKIVSAIIIGILVLAMVVPVLAYIV